MISIAVNRGGFRAEFNRVLGRAVNPTAILIVAGRELGNQLKAWFRRKEQENPNKLSPRRQHFWLQIMRSVNAPEQTGYNQISVRISDPRIAQKVFGGTIRAKEAGALTIPVEERAYGRTAATFEAETGLKLFLVKKKDDATGRGGRLAVKAESGGITVEYVLTKSVEQQPDKTALPPTSDLEKAILERAQKAADRQENAKG